MRRWLALLLVVFMAPWQATAATVQVSTGEHPGFTRLVLQYDAPVNWVIGRTPDGYELRLPETTVQYDLSRVFDQIGRTRLAAIWADPATGALHVGVGCACYAMPFEFRPGVVVIDLKDGAPPKGSSFEVPLDGSVAGQLAPRPVLRPKPRPGGSPKLVYDWTSLTRSPTKTPPDAPPIPPHGTALALIDPMLEPLRQALIEQLSRGASQGIVDMVRPKAAKADGGPATPQGDVPVQIHLGAVPGLVVRQKGDGDAPLTAAGADCIADDRLEVVAWADTSPVADQIGPALSGLTGEFDRPDPASVKRAIRFDLSLGFGAEARALIRVFPTGDADTAIWQSMARILDDQVDPHPAFAGMAACDSAAALWAILADPNIRSVEIMQKSAILRSFSALPAHLRRQLGPVLVDRFLAMDDVSTATALRDAVLRAPGEPGPEIDLMQARMTIATGQQAAAEARLESLSSQSGPGAPEALIALVEHRVELGQEVSFAQVLVLQEYLKERRGGAEEAKFRHALILARAASGDFDTAFATLASAPAAAAVLWQSLARTGPDSALLAHATLAVSALPPGAAKPVVTLIADRMLALGLADQAARWLQLDDSPPALLLARVALARGDAQTALTILKDRAEPAALPLRAEALHQLGAEPAAAEIYGSLGLPDQQWNAILRARDWPRLASAGPAAMRAAATLLLAPAAGPPQADPTSPAGPLAQGQALVSHSVATRAAIAQLLDTVKSPSSPTQ